MGKKKGKKYVVRLTEEEQAYLCAPSSAAGVLRPGRSSGRGSF